MTTTTGQTQSTASLSIMELKDTLTVMVSKYNLAYDLTQSPVKVGPDCYMFYATPLDALCRKKGLCTIQSYYALTGGETIVIMDKNKNHL
jgi:hypothetical protein